jgi:malonate decarboxylase gamma subunit
VADDTPLGVDDAIWLAGQVLSDPADRRPILILIDSDSQRMARRDELLGVSEYLAHLAKALLLAEAEGRRTIGLLYGHTAAGAFIATALAAGTLVALPGANPEVMDLPSISRVTKLPLDTLQAMAKTTPVFAPGLDNLAQTGAVLEVWDPAQPLDGQLAALLAQPTEGDQRDLLGKARGGRPKAAEIAQRVFELAQADG